MGDTVGDADKDRHSGVRSGLAPQKVVRKGTGAGGQDLERAWGGAAP